MSTWYSCSLCSPLADVKNGQQVAWALCLCSLIKLFPKLPGALSSSSSSSLTVSQYTSFLSSSLTEGLQDFVLETDRSLEVN